MEISCPKCGSHDLHAGKKGFSGTKAVGGAVLTGGLGLLAGTIGSNKVVITCLKCGNHFKPGETQYNALRGNHKPARQASNAEKKVANVLGLILAIVCGFFTLILLIVAFTGEIKALWGVLFLGLLTAFFLKIARQK